MRARSFFVWASLIFAVTIPVVIAAVSPLQAYRPAVYIIGGIAGIVALALLLFQPLLAAGYLPGLRGLQQRKWHRWIGSAITVAVALHIGGLYLTSPPDTLDALLLVSPTPFSVYGVIGLWALIATALLVAARSRMRLSYAVWRVVHNVLAAVVVVATVTHALLIEGTMGTVSKTALCALVIVATAFVIIRLRVIDPIVKRKR